MERIKNKKPPLYILRKHPQWLIVILICIFCLFSQSKANAPPEKSSTLFCYVSVSPSVNKVDDLVRFSCVFSPYTNPENVTIHLHTPLEQILDLKMEELKTGKYVNTSSFTLTGRYSFVIIAVVDNQSYVSSLRSFWITNSLFDKDDDNMKDEWELFYGFNPNDPHDAFGDYDNDGYKNLDEYKMNTNPLDDDRVEIVFYFFHKHCDIIVLTMCFICCSLLFSIVGLRRSTKWI